jgi:uncharacterized damage-inducible protein DinB
MASSDRRVLDALLDSWDRNNTITVNLLRKIPPDALDLRPAPGSPSIAELFAHLHFVRLIFVAEDAPELAVPLSYKEWMAERDPDRLAQMLNDSVRPVQEAVRRRLEAGREMDVHFDHPILMLQHLIWHDAYHHGQIKLTLKLAGRPLDDEDAGPVTWDVWLNKRPDATASQP